MRYLKRLYIFAKVYIIILNCEMRRGFEKILINKSTFTKQ